MFTAFWQVNIEIHHLYQWQKYRIIYLHLPLLSKYMLMLLLQYVFLGYIQDLS